MSYPPNKIVLEPAKPLDALYVVIDGAVELSRSGESLTTARQNDVLGAWALFEENDPMPVTARTVEDTRLLRIARDDFYDLLSDNSEITSAIFSTLVKRFRKLVAFPRIPRNMEFHRQELTPQNSLSRGPVCRSALASSAVAAKAKDSQMG